MKRYDIYWVSLDPVEGAEMGKARPCVIVSDDIRNRNLGTLVVCPLTTLLCSVADRGETAIMRK